MRVHVDRRGSGPAIIFLHGIGSSSATWDRVMTLLQDRYTVAAFDLLGHGDSPVPDDPAEYARDRALEDIDDVIASLDGPTVLVGHSLGGYLALAHAATRPGVAQGIVVLNTGPGFRDPEKREAWNDRSRRNAHRFGVPPQAAEMNLQEDGVVMERLAEIDVPTIVLAGTADRPEYAGAGQYLERKMPNARFIAIEGGEHAMHEDSHADEVAAIVAELAGSAGRSAD
ncbi:MAG: alpha/beta fold hydrolase [Actinomycetota bacterium]